VKSTNWFENQPIENRKIELHFSRFNFNKINILNCKNNRLKIIADQYCTIFSGSLSEINMLKYRINRLTDHVFANRGIFKWNQHVEMKNQQVEYDYFQIFYIQQQIFRKPMHEYIRLTCYKHIRPHYWCLMCLVQFLAC